MILGMFLLASDSDSGLMTVILIAVGFLAAIINWVSEWQGWG